MNVEMHLLPNGNVQHDYGPCSCLSCGGRVTATHDEAGKESARCVACGTVVYVVFDNDAGDLVEGFMTPGELRGARPLGDDHDPA